MKRPSPVYRFILLATCTLFFPEHASAHGIVGDRFFPPTITTDDPFAVDELALPTLSYFKNPGDDGSPATREIDAGFEFDKEIFPHFALGISDTHLSLQPVGGSWSNGWGNFTVTAKYQLWQNDPHEAVISVGLETDLGGTGSRSIDRESFTTFSPTVYFGKGFGDLRQQAAFLKPLAVTGTFGQSFPTESIEPNAFSWGFAIEYSLPYLQQQVKNVGLPAPFKNMIPLVEISMETTENRGQTGITTGTVNPGILWETKHFQLGAEALIPINHRSGGNVGVVVQMWIYIDDLFPQIFGHPIIGVD